MNHLTVAALHHILDEAAEAVYDPVRESSIIIIILKLVLTCVFVGIFHGHFLLACKSL